MEIIKKEEIITAKIREGNISLVLDSYDDIFSDFDPRPYSVRALSDDFLLECKKATLDKKDKIELRLLVPENKRNPIDEIKIKKRLKEHFNKHFKEEQKEIKKIKTNGVFWFFCGAIVMTLSLFLLNYQNFLFRLLLIMAEPAGWFFFWEGLSKFFIISNEHKPGYEFYKKMSNSEILFFDY